MNLTGFRSPGNGKSQTSKAEAIVGAEKRTCPLRDQSEGATLIDPMPAASAASHGSTGSSFPPPAALFWTSPRFRFVRKMIRVPSVDQTGEALTAGPKVKRDEF